MTPTMPSTWLGIVSAVVGIASVLVVRWWGSRDKDAADDARRDRAVSNASKMWRQAMQEGDTAGMVKWKKRYDYLCAGGKFFFALVAVLMLAGCATRKFAAVPVTQHILFPQPGDPTPALPKDEVGWLLLSIPIGVSLALPTEFPWEDVQSVP